MLRKSKSAMVFIFRNLTAISFVPFGKLTRSIVISIVFLGLLWLNSNEGNRTSPASIGTPITEKTHSVSFVEGVSKLEGSSDNQFNWMISRNALAQIKNSSSDLLQGWIDLVIEPAPCDRKRVVTIVSSQEIQKFDIGTKLMVRRITVVALPFSTVSIWFETTGLPCIIKSDPRTFYLSLRVANTSWD
jgi:hypothetical protein